MPTGYVWHAGIGWVKKKRETERSYEEIDAESWCLLISYWRWYPDALLDILRDENAENDLEWIQRLIIRVFARFREAMITGSRSLTKTYSSECQRLTKGILYPNTEMRYFGPSLIETAQIGVATFQQIKKDYPALANHYVIKNASSDKFEVKTAYGSCFTIKTMRGDNAHDSIAEEYAKEELPRFDYETYQKVVLPAIRLQHKVNGVEDPNFIDYQKHAITSAGRQQNHAYATRCDMVRRIGLGEKDVFVMDASWEIIVLMQMRPYEWAMHLKHELTPEQWLREMESIYTGTVENPVIREETLTESKTMLLMEERHCGDPNATYIIGYDVSYEDNARNAKCAASVLKLTKQTAEWKKDKYLKSLIFVNDSPPPADAILQARKLKDLWYSFVMENGKPTYIAIDGWQYGKAVIEALMRDLNDGLPPLCCFDHCQYRENELPNALPVIYPIKAGGVGVTDPDADMIRYAEVQFEARNVQLLTTNIAQGVEAYKRMRKILDPNADASIAVPYLKTRELCGQIQNLKKVPTGTGFGERRISNHIQRDMWSSLKYALRLAQILEHRDFLAEQSGDDTWAKEAENYMPSEAVQAQGTQMPPSAGRRFGKMF